MAVTPRIGLLALGLAACQPAQLETDDKSDDFGARYGWMPRPVQDAYAPDFTELQLETRARRHLRLFTVFAQAPPSEEDAPHALPYCDRTDALRTKVAEEDLLPWDQRFPDAAPLLVPGSARAMASAVVIAAEASKAALSLWVLTAAHAVFGQEGCERTWGEWHPTAELRVVLHCKAHVAGTLREGRRRRSDRQRDWALLRLEAAPTALSLHIMAELNAPLPTSFARVAVGRPLPVAALAGPDFSAKAWLSPGRWREARALSEMSQRSRELREQPDAHLLRQGSSYVYGFEDPVAIAGMSGGAAYRLDTGELLGLVVRKTIPDEPSCTEELLASISRLGDFGPLFERLQAEGRSVAELKVERHELAFDAATSAAHLTLRESADEALIGLQLDLCQHTQDNIILTPISTHLAARYTEDSAEAHRGTLGTLPGCPGLHMQAFWATQAIDTGINHSGDSLRLLLSPVAASSAPRVTGTLNALYLPKQALTKLSSAP